MRSDPSTDGAAAIELFAKVNQYFLPLGGRIRQTNRESRVRWERHVYIVEVPTL